MDVDNAWERAVDRVEHEASLLRGLECDKVPREVLGDPVEGPAQRLVPLGQLEARLGLDREDEVA